MEFEQIYYVVIVSGRYFKISKIGANTDPETGKKVETILNDYFYPSSQSFIQSINEERETDRGTQIFFGLLLINSLSQGTFVFSIDGIEQNIYVDVDRLPMSYDSLVTLFSGQ